MTDNNWLSEREGKAWRGFLALRAVLDLQIGRDLASDSGLSEADYHVLATLSAAEQGRLRLTELGNGMLWSTSRTAHQVSRMQRRGLVRKTGLPGNSRAAVIMLTEAGASAIRAAAPLHVASVRSHLIDHLTVDQLDAIAEAGEVVVARYRSGPDRVRDRESEG
ncbi:MarR family winged helix-turn-helix transcriptional regulator [Brevibacterium aurantiacum]|uniref:HTH marR-type domain-containing protein n=1 Tax=Brevibacterium aurantiacum TaxID=273384 RepID=A0A2A3ZA57_BREAU|nr:MarR family transcriptional regulator [Brevibacterium aurantiacum]PCC48468.1 hypothetical protein CIK64_01585 [Brevibacterium aurantiacum]